MNKHLKNKYGFNSFRESQKEIIKDLLDNNNVFCILPTGGGKSLLYQFPATFTNKISIVVSPLISLMNDQVINLKIKGIKSCSLNSETNIDFNSISKYQIIYTTPEFLSVNINIFDKISDKICLFAIDEAHCISQWSHDFRPSYKSLSIIKTKYPNIPLLAVTATATPNVIDEMEKCLNIDNVILYLGGTQRPNLFIEVKAKEEFTLEYDEPTIIYVQTRKICNKLHTMFENNNIKTLKYHGGMNDVEKQNAHKIFSEGTINIIIATISFGMGIDKSNIRNVINYGIPTDIETYYQEIGRAGRDGLRSSAILYYDKSDFNFANYIINTTKNEQQQNRKRLSLNILSKYLSEHELCRHKMIDYYFETGEFCKESDISTEKCNMCDNCTNTTKNNLQDVTCIATKIYNYVNSLNINVGVVKLTNTLVGYGTPILKNQDPILSNYNPSLIRLIIDKMITKSFLLMSKWKDYGFVLSAGKSIDCSVFIIAPEISEKIENKLIKIRDIMCKKYNVDQLTFLNDKILKNIEIANPKTLEELWLVDGITEAFIINYGSEFINKITETKKNRSKNTVDETYNLYKEGKSISEIASQRNLTEITIENHIIEKWKNNKSEISKNYCKLTPTIENEIINAISKVGIDKLRPIKDIVSKNISYFQIRTVILSN
jgi:ATP-dependent DNA helicase RecQ